ncbi:hypothetical protein AHOG_21275 [Actinoalloteichus hoggarensis]|uniref:Uncharacterized protein n=1 Tax=Actinoalloteichus hoggarensis TaxID=1470176 RepID=A0A221W875_9PSEU|nr:hypothetical protein AHOG_21275 [Actinoalloteichus hoggarensis]
MPWASPWLAWPPWGRAGRKKVLPGEGRLLRRPREHHAAVPLVQRRPFREIGVGCVDREDVQGRSRAAGAIPPQDVICHLFGGRRPVRAVGVHDVFELGCGDLAQSAPVGQGRAVHCRRGPYRQEGSTRPLATALVWAIMTARLSGDEAAEGVGVQDTGSASGHSCRGPAVDAVDQHRERGVADTGRPDVHRRQGIAGRESTTIRWAPAHSRCSSAGAAAASGLGRASPPGGTAVNGRTTARLRRRRGRRCGRRSRRRAHHTASHGPSASGACCGGERWSIGADDMPARPGRISPARRAPPRFGMPRHPPALRRRRRQRIGARAMHQVRGPPSGSATSAVTTKPSRR